MRVAVQTILDLSIEQKQSGVEWPHPWDHYPFLSDGQQIWKRYQDLTPDQKHQLTQAMNSIRLAQGQNDNVSYTNECQAARLLCK